MTRLFGDDRFGDGTFGGLASVTPPASGNTYTVEVDFTTALLGVPSAWVDVTDAVRNFSTRRGRSHELGKMQAGEASLTLDNRDRRFDPTNTAGPFYPNVVPMRHVRIRATTASLVNYDLFRGFVEDWGQQWSGPHASQMGDAFSEVHVVDAFKVLNLVDLTAYGPEVLNDEPLLYYPLDGTEGGTQTNHGSIEDAMLAPDVNMDGPMFLDPSPLLGGDLAFTDTHGHSGLGVAFGSGAAYPTNTLNQLARKAFLNDWTLEGWFRTGSGSSAGSSVNIRSATQDWATLAYQTSGKLQVTVGTTSFVRTTGTWTTNAWHHFAAVRRGTTVDFYADGVLAETVSGLMAVDPDDTGTTIVELGIITDSSGLAHAAAYGYALSPARIAAHFAAKTGTIVPQPVHTAITAVLDAIGWPSGLRSITTSSHTVQAHVPDPNALTELLMLAEDTDGGTLYATGTGVLKFRSATDLLTDTVVAAAWGDTTAELRYSGLTLRDDDADLYTEVRATADGLTDAVATDATAALTYGPRTLESGAGVLGDQNQLADRATGYLSRYKAPSLRPETLVAVDSASQPARTTEIFAADIGRRVTVTRRPPGGGSPITITSLVEGVAYSPVEALTQMRATLNLVPVLDPTPWVLADATNGVLSSTTDLGW